MMRFSKRELLVCSASLLTCVLLYAGGWLHGRFIAGSWPFATADSGGGSDFAGTTPVEPADDHSGHDHAGHAEDNSLELSETARKNLGLSDEFLQPIELTSFQRSISVPAIVVDLPGRTRLPVSSSMTGIVTHVHAVSGEAVQPGDLLLEMRLTHEDLVTAQKDYLQSLGDRDIELKEIARIEELAKSGAVPPKTLLEKQYLRDKVESSLKSQREALRLHGLSDAQIQMIETQRRLLTEMRIMAPDPDNHSVDEIQLSRQVAPTLGMNVASPEVGASQPPRDNPFRSVSLHETTQSASEQGQGESPSVPAHKVAHFLVLQDSHVQKGQVVNAGDLLCTLADYSQLLIEGQAFETEASQVAKAKLDDWPVSAIVDEGGKPVKIENLKFGWVENEIDPTARTLKFYILLPNILLQDSRNSTGQRHIAWKYRTGQRMQLQVPVEQWAEQFVLPVDAVVREGLESYVFQQNGDHFDRVSVHERFRDQLSVVIDNDGALYPGDVVALRGAHQMQMALKNKAGRGADPHAGHSH